MHRLIHHMIRSNLSVKTNVICFRNFYCMNDNTKNDESILTMFDRN